MSKDQQDDPLPKTLLGLPIEWTDESVSDQPIILAPFETYKEGGGVTDDFPAPRISTDGQYVLDMIYNPFLGHPQGHWSVYLIHAANRKHAKIVSWDEAVEMGLFSPGEDPETVDVWRG
ncbi:MAG TPA: hypothetical protein VMW24_24665 [Sedimentisphaerales bacterium]|nr:hypothetical protein [Sedimentisphaerales bacterium]